MRVEVDHYEIQEALGAYSLNAVDAAEAAIIEGHVEWCTQCRQELNEHYEVAAMLSATERFAPTELWDTIVRQMPSDHETAGTASIRAADTSVVPLRRKWLKPATAAAAVLLLLATAVLQSARLATADDELVAQRAMVTRLREQLARPPLDVAVVEALADTGSQQFTLGSEVSGSSAIIVLMPDGTGYLAEHSLRPLPADRTYQLWAVIDGKVISAGVLGPDPGVVPFRIDPQGFAGFAITEEVVGGVESSQNDAVIAWLET